MRTLHARIHTAVFRYDEAQLRFGRGSKLDEDFYVRQDGTCAYFFDIDRLQEQCRCGYEFRPLYMHLGV